jgi:hypothetical protein
VNSESLIVNGESWIVNREWQGTPPIQALI